jgi:hypothetical protein
MNVLTRSVLLRIGLALATLVILFPPIIDLVSLFICLITIYLALEVWRLDKRKSALISTSFIFSALFLYLGLPPALVVALWIAVSSLIIKDKALSNHTLAAWVTSVAILQIPPVTTGLSLIAYDTFSWAGVVAMPLTFVLLCTLSGLFRFAAACVMVVAILFLAVMGNELEWSPYFLAMICALPASMVIVHQNERKGFSLKLMHGLLIVLGVFSLSWLAPASSITSNAAVWLPMAKTPTSRYFEEYVSVLRLAGFQSIREIYDSKEVKAGEIVLLPNAAHSEFKEQLNALKGLPHYASLRIIVFGEHTNVDGVATALNEIKAPVRLNADTTLPPKNGNILGWAGATGFAPPPTIALNRGASVSHHSILAAPILWVTGGHREFDSSADGRLGDYIFRKNESVGLYSAMSIGRQIGGPTWIVVGDSSPALNELLISNPRSFAELLAMSTGIPTILAILFWLTLSAACMNYRSPFKKVALAFSLCFGLAVPASAHHFTNLFHNSDTALVTIVDRDMYGDRAVGRALVSISSELVKNQIFIEVGNVSAEPTKKKISIGHPDGWLNRLDCTRAGGLNAKVLFLLDVVTCPEVREDVIFKIGDDAIVYKIGSNVVILDQHFISNSAPITNIEWLKSLIISTKIFN